MTSIKLADVKGLMINKIEPCDHWQKNKTLKLSRVEKCFNEAIDLQGQRKITLNRERLIATCSQYFVDLGHAAIKAKLKNSKMVISPARGLADVIISSLPELVEVVE